MMIGYDCFASVINSTHCPLKRELNNKIVSSGLNKVSVSLLQRESVIAGVYFSQTSVTLARDFAALHISGVSVKARCPQGKG